MKLEKMFIFFFLLTNNLQAMEESKTSTIFPDNIICNIASNFNRVIGTTSWINKKDLPIIIKNIKTLSLVNKKMHAVLNSSEYTPQIIESVAQRFDLSQEDAATELNMRGTQEWFVNRLKESLDYKLFKQIQKIVKIAQDLANTHKDPSKKKRVRQNLNELCPQKELSIILSHYSLELLTPWGMLKLDRGSGAKPFLVAQELFKNLTVTLDCFRDNSISDYELNYWRVNKEITPDSDEYSYREKITDPLFYKGKSDILVCDMGGVDACYKISKVNEECILQQDLLVHKTNTRNTRMQEWRALQKIYNAEMNIVPEEQKEEEHFVYKAPLCHLCEKKLFSGSIIHSSCCDKQMHRNCRFVRFEKRSDCSWCHQKISEKTKQEEKILYPDHINGLPALCSYLAEQLNSQIPNSNNENKQLDLNDSHNTCIFTLMTRAANHQMDKKDTWKVSDLEDRQTQKPQISLRSQKHCSVEKLQECYNIALTNIKKGWKRAKLENYPTIYHLQSEENYQLFIKEKSFEANLITTLAGKFAVDLYCKNEWVDRSENWGYKSTDTLYMWVKKDQKNLEKFHKVFEFEIE